MDWSEGAREEFRKRTEEIELGKGGVNKVIERLIERIKGAVRMKRRRRKAKGRRGWWNGECRRKKKEVERTLKKWRKGNRSREDYRREKREYKEMCERKRRQENEE